jgi:uncharacterized phage protein (TIGR02218 family)
MKTISEEFAARLAAEVATLCACWRFTRRDEEVFGATDHDQPVTFDGVTYQPANGIAGAQFESGVTLAPGRAAARGALDADFVTEDDLAAGLWDGARVDIWRVDWTEPELRLRVWSGELSEVSRSAEAFSAELVSLKAGLERTIGRVYSRKCDAVVGDVRCGVNLTAPSYRGSATVTEVLGPKRLRVSGLGGFEAGWFDGGMLSWATGPNAGSTRRVARHSGNEIDLALAPRIAASVGDALVVSAGCAKDFATCGVKFANHIRFRGFPHLPGMDAVLAGPASDRPNDGGRRA